MPSCMRLQQLGQQNICNKYHIYNNRMEHSLDLVWPAEKTIRADLISNRHFFRLLLKFALIFLTLSYTSRMLPDAQQLTTSTPEKWQQVDILEIHDVSPLGRSMKIYAAPANPNQDMDLVHQVEVYSLVDSEEKEKVMDVRVGSMDDFVDISEGGLRFYFGDLHVLGDVAYRVKMFKPMKLGGRLLTNLTEIEGEVNSTSTVVEIEENNSTVEANETEWNATQQQMERKRTEEEEKKRREEQEARKKEEQRQKQQEQVKKRQEEEQRRKEQEQRQRLYDHTNIRLQVKQMSNFATILQLFIRYISMLVIIYIAADNPDAPRSIPIICAITSNPLLFLQISYPNRVSDVIDCLCRSGPLLYFPVWLFYIHTRIKFPDQTKQKVYLGVKIALGIALYTLNTMRLLHIPAFALQTLISIILISLVGSYLWQAFLDLQHQHHRDKVLVVVTMGYLGCLFTFKVITGPWKDLMLYIIHQAYGLLIIYLMACPKKPKVKRRKSSASGVKANQVPGELGDMSSKK